MQCAVHADRLATHSVGEAAACPSCVESARERTATFGSSLPILVAIAYLVALAIGYVVLKGRPIVGGLAAVASLFVGRTLQVLVLRRVAPLPPARVDASKSDK